jgi:deazaflavin-dependent oxidoreductase (nitroreductase family)
MPRAGVGRRPGWEAAADRLRLFALHATLYRWLGGRGMGAHTLLLTTTGRRSGRPRTTPLLYVREGDDLFVIASNGGDERPPGWWYNLRANPNAEVQIGRERIRCRVDALAPAEAARVWPGLCALHRGYERYRARTRRELTIFRLRRSSATLGS